MDLLESNKIYSTKVTVPNNCTDLFQPLDLSVNKPFKDQLQGKFSEWYVYAQEVSKQSESGKQIDKSVMTHVCR